LLEYGLLHRGGGGGEPYAAEADALCKDEYGQDGWLLERRRWAEQVLISVVATAYLLGVSTRPVEKLAGSLGVTPAVEVAGLGDGQASGRTGRRVP
jgi:hypothetical protein